MIYMYIIFHVYFQVLNFDRFTWSTASSKIYLSPSSLPLKIPACKGHSLVLLYVSTAILFCFVLFCSRIVIYLRFFNIGIFYVMDEKI